VARRVRGELEHDDFTRSGNDAGASLLRPQLPASTSDLHVASVRSLRIRLVRTDLHVDLDLFQRLLLL